MTTYPLGFSKEDIDDSELMLRQLAQHRRTVISWLPPVKCSEAGCTYCDSANYTQWDDEEVASKQVEVDADRHVDLLRERAKQLKTLCGPQSFGAGGHQVRTSWSSNKKIKYYNF
jgi:hypothetical protein